MADNKFSNGQTVLLEVKTLHGVAATVIDGDDSNYVLRISEEGFEGHLVMFPADVLVALTDPKVKNQHKDNLKAFRADQDRPEGPLDVAAGQRLAWNY